MLKMLSQSQQFARFRSGNFDIKDEPHSGRPMTNETDKILEKFEQDRHINNDS